MNHGCAYPNVFSNPNGRGQHTHIYSYISTQEKNHTGYVGPKCFQSISKGGRDRGSRLTIQMEKCHHQTNSVIRSIYRPLCSIQAYTERQKKKLYRMYICMDKGGIYIGCLHYTFHTIFSIHRLFIKND